MAWRVEVRRRDAADILSRLPPQTKQAIRAALGALARRGPRHPDVRALASPPGQPQVYRLRVGDYRAAFQVDGHTLRVIRIFHRSQGYAWLDGPSS